MFGILLVLTSAGIVALTERFVKPWVFRSIIVLFVFGTACFVVFNAGLSAGDSAARSEISRELSQELQEIETKLGTNNVPAVNDEIGKVQARLLKIVTASE